MMDAIVSGIDEFARDRKNKLEDGRYARSEVNYAIVKSSIDLRKAGTAVFS